MGVVALSISQYFNKFAKIETVNLGSRQRSVKEKHAGCRHTSNPTGLLGIELSDLKRAGVLLRGGLRVGGLIKNLEVEIGRIRSKLLETGPIRAILTAEPAGCSRCIVKFFSLLFTRKILHAVATSVNGKYFQWDNDGPTRSSLRQTGRTLTVKKNVVPQPTALSAQTFPPWLCTMCLTMASPRPVPPLSRERALSTR